MTGLELVKSKKLHFLVVEDDLLTQQAITAMLKGHGTVTTASSSREACLLIDKQGEKFDLALIDLHLSTSSNDGLALIPPIVQKGIYPVVVTGEEKEQVIEQAYTLGCRDYLIKPFKSSSLEIMLNSFGNQKENRLANQIRQKFITNDLQLTKLLEDLSLTAYEDSPIFLAGESGTGKTMLAKLLHQATHTSLENFVHLNCAAIPTELLESELFGYVKGAFTGATSNKTGKLYLANGGTLFLDEVATLPHNLQGKLLKVLDDHEVVPVGSNTAVKTNFRLISATCQDLKKMVQNNSFREDLYYRLEGSVFTIPPLRHRPDDIPLLIKKMMSKKERQVVITKSAMKYLLHYSWPGNIRELSFVVEQLRRNKRGIVDTPDLPRKITNSNNDSMEYRTITSQQIKLVQQEGLKALLSQIEKDVVKSFYQKNSQRVRETLRELKISSTAFYRIMRHGNG